MINSFKKVVFSHYFTTIVLMSCLLILSACQSQPVSKSTTENAAESGSNMLQKSIKSQNTSEAGPKRASLSPETSWVIGAIVTSMRGNSLSNDTSKHIELADGLAKSIREKSFLYGGFTLTSVAVSEYHYLESDPNTRWLSAFLRFYDDYNRSVTTAVRTEYRLAGEKIIVESVIIMPLASNNPQLNLYFVPVNKLSDHLFKKANTYKQLLRLVQDNAVPVNIPGQLPHKQQDYWIFAFVMNRLPGEAKIDMRVSKTPEGLKGDNVKVTTRNIDNWFITRAKERFALGTKNKMFYKVLYSFGNDLPREKNSSQLIGVFSTQ